MTSMYDIITIGSATVDLFMKSAQFHLQPAEEGVLLCEEYGGKIDVQEFEMQSGGAGTNTAVGFARMGFKTAAVAEIGKDMFAQMILDDLCREHVETEYIVSEKSERTAVSALLISGEGGRTALTHRGAASMLEARDLPWEALWHTRWVHLSNVGGNQELLFQLFDHLRPTMVGLSWNPGKNELELIAQGRLQISQVVCDIFVLNKEEWQVIESKHQEIVEQIPFVVVTDGRKGGVVYIRGQYEHPYESQVVPVKQETGAGDAFVVGFVSGHLLNQPPQECCHWGVKNAANVVQHMGAKTGLLRKRDFGL